MSKDELDDAVQAAISGQCNTSRTIEALISHSLKFQLKQGHLDQACQNGDLNVVRLLLEKTNVSECCLEDSFELSARFGHLDIVRFFLDSLNINVKSISKQAIYAACEFGHLSLVVYLQSKGAEFDLVSLELAVESGNQGLVANLLSTHCREIVSSDNFHDLVISSVRNGDHQIAFYLMENLPFSLNKGLLKEILDDCTPDAFGAWLKNQGERKNKF
jgi:hypothetical protein